MTVEVLVPPMSECVKVELSTLKTPTPFDVIVWFPAIIIHTVPYCISIGSFALYSVFIIFLVTLEKIVKIGKDKRRVSALCGVPHREIL